MFFTISKIEQAVHTADHLKNPEQGKHSLLFRVFRTQSRTAFTIVYAKRAFGEFSDVVSQQKIARRQWTPEMKAFAAQKVAEAPKPPFIFKLTIAGWIFAFLVAAFFVYLIYDSAKPPLPKSVKQIAMEQSPATGDIYFGHFESFKNPGDPIASEVGFGWFKIVKVEGAVYHIARSTQMTKTHHPKEELNSIDFQSESIPALIIQQEAYSINLKSIDEKMEIYINDKK